ncbi:MAG: nuclear transport factor 2 family protein [Caulobacteraceae bacterium]
MTHPAAKLSAEDRLDILDLFARYSWGIDLADKELVLSCFTDDSFFDHLWQGRVQGRAAILKNLESLWYDRQSWWYGRQHLFNHQLVEPITTEAGEPGARVKSFFQILQHNVDYGTNFVFGIGTRDDTLVKRDGQWFFLTLYVNAWISRETVPWKGEITMPPRPGQAPRPNPNGAPPEMTRELSGAGG